MPKFEVNIVKTVWEECWIEIEAANGMRPRRWH
jgi:hypothetical protein